MMASYYTLWTTSLLLMVFLLWLTTCQCKDLYVDSSTQEKDAPCTKDHPCMSIQHAVNQSEPGDVVLLTAGVGPRYPPYIINSLSIPWNLTIKAGIAASVPVITCNQAWSTCNVDVKTSDSALNTTELTLEDINIKGCDLCFKNASVVLNEVCLVNVQLTVEARNNNQVVVNSSIFNDTKVIMNSLCVKPSVCNYSSLILSMKDTDLYGESSSLSLFNISDADVMLENVEFSGFGNQVRLASTTTLKLDITKLQVHDFNTAASGFSLDLTRGDLMGSIVDSSFENNIVLIGGALSLSTGKTSRVNLDITNTTFRNNSCDTAGSAMNLALSEQHILNEDDIYDIVQLMMQNIHIDGCNFTQNENQESAAGIYISGGNVTITGSTFKENRVSTALSIKTRLAERKGAGGAIYGMSTSNIQIDDCSFIDNSANWFGGAVAGEGAISITNSYFETNRSAHSTLGELLYLSGPTQVGNLTFNVVIASRNVPMIWYSGNRASVLQGVGEGFMDFHCPVGAQFKNNTLPEFDKVAAYRDFFYFCEPCPDDTYSLQHGYRSGPLEMDEGKWSEDFKCLPCSYGGVCKEGKITSQYNFWGHAAGDPPQVSMQMCPESYCCQEAKCDTYDTCAGNRSGTLCGQCRKGMSEMLYTTECVEDHKCNDVWVFAVDLITSLITLVFFLYQLEIVGIVCKYLFWADVSENDDPTFAGFIKSIFYFYQTVDLLKVQDNQASKIVGVAIQPVISYLLSFKSIAIIFGACPFPGMNPVSKTILKSMPTVYVLSFLGILTLIYTILQYRKSQQEPSPYVHFQRRSSTAPIQKRTLGSRLAAACLSYFLFNYISISNMTFTLLACTPVGDKNVLFIDGNVQCVQPWQSVFILIAIIHVCPFFMAVIASRYLYDRDLISTRQFFISYFLPLPMLIYWAIAYNTKWKGMKGIIIEDAMQEDSAIDEPKPSLSEDEVMKVSILGMIEEPFVDHTNAESARYWEGILIFRRLVLSAIAAFTVQPLLSITLQTMVCFAFLLWHVHIHPFGSKAANNFETTSLSILSVIGMYHMIQATLLSSGIPAIGPNKTQIFITDWIEWILVSLFPMLLGLAFVVFLFIRLFMAIGSGCKFLLQRNRDSRDRSEYSSPF